MKKISYALFHKELQKTVGYNVESNKGKDCCGETTVSLDTYSKNRWTTETLVGAEWVRNNSTEWYNSEMETPSHSFEPEELEVIKIVTEETVSTESFTLPTYEEYIKEKYEKSEPKHYEYLMSLVKKGEEMRYDLHELKEHLRKVSTK